MLVLIGSRALDAYGRLKNRLPDDWDFLYEGPQKKMGKAEYYDAREGTNVELFEYSLTYSEKKVKTPYGTAIVAPLEVLKLLKLSSIPVEKAKHEWDLKQLEDVEIPKYLNKTLQNRFVETEKRVKLQKDRFFNKYHVPRIMEHDELHKYVNPSPLYLEALSDPVTVSQDKFLSLSRDKQIGIVREEMFVLALERNLIPEVVSKPHLVNVLVEKFSKVEKSNDYAYLWLSRLSIPGKLKDHPNWLAVWVSDHYNLIIEGLDDWWKAKILNLSEDFWTKLLN